MKTQAARIFMIIGLLMGALSGCGQSSESTEKNQVTGSQDQNVEVTEENIVEEKVVTEEEKEHQNEEVVQEASGTFVGLIDNHTIEVTVEGEPTAFQLSNDVKDQVESLSEGNEITFTFTEDTTVGQKTIVGFN